MFSRWRGEKEADVVSEQVKEDFQKKLVTAIEKEKEEEEKLLEKHDTIIDETAYVSHGQIIALTVDGNLTADERVVMANVSAAEDIQKMDYLSQGEYAKLQARARKKLLHSKRRP